MCVNIICENNGICLSSHLSWMCRCLDETFYSGKYCQHKSTALVVKQILGRSFASIVIAAIIAVFLFVIIMDILKYGFMIDPVDRERRLIELNRNREQSDKSKKKKHRKFVIEPL